MITRDGIRRYRILGLDISINIGWIYSVSIFCLTTAYFLVSYLSNAFFVNHTGYNNLLIMVFSVFLASITILPINYLIQEFLDKIFNKSKYDFVQTLFEISQSISILANLEKLLKYTTRIIVRKLRLRNATILIYDGKKEKYMVKAFEGADQSIGTITFTANFPLVEYLKNKREPLSLNMVKTILRSRTLDLNEQDKFNFIRSDMLKLNAALTIPIMWKDDLIGILCLGGKISGDKFTKEDISLFTIFSNQAAIAIKNSMLYSDLNKTSNQLNMLLVAIKKTSETTDIKRKTEIIVSSLYDTLDFVDACSVRLFDDKTGSLLPTGNSDEDFCEITHGNSQEWNSFKDHRILSSHNMEIQDMHSVFRSKLILPLLVNNNCIGILTIKTKNKHDYSKDEIELVSAFISKAITVQQ